MRKRARRRGGRSMAIAVCIALAASFTRVNSPRPYYIFKIMPRMVFSTQNLLLCYWEGGDPALSGTLCLRALYISRSTHHNFWRQMQITESEYTCLCNLMFLQQIIEMCVNALQWTVGRVAPQSETSTRGCIASRGYY